MEKEIKILKPQMTVRCYLKKIKKEQYPFVEGIIEEAGEDFIKLIGVYRGEKFYKKVLRKNCYKFTDPGFDLILPEKLISNTKLIKQKLEVKERIGFKPVLLKNIFQKIKIGMKVRYFFNNPVESFYLEGVIVFIKKKNPIVIKMVTYERNVKTFIEPLFEKIKLEIVGIDKTFFREVFLDKKFYNFVKGNLK